MTRLDFAVPYGCLWCGEERHLHGRRWRSSVGVHSWTPPDEELILDRMQRRRAARPARPVTAQDRMRAVHADAYPGTGGDPICATCHRIDCPRYWRIQNRLDTERAAARTVLLAADYDEEPW
ncbi:hypothetical protein ACF061_00785 [Streptomyces sp. NPDC015220]|uniref:hypothetical protein n=1 Tax=Streptomyces sp. NPDC015220 TaxID=3364947 RepID=UPI0036FD529B